MVIPNTSEEMKPLSLIVHHELENVIPNEPLIKVSSPIKLVLKKSTHGDEAMSNNSLKPNIDELSYHEYIEIFNEPMEPRRTDHRFRALPKIFNNFYTSKKGGVLSTLSIFKLKGVQLVKFSVRGLQP